MIQRSRVAPTGATIAGTSSTSVRVCGEANQAGAVVRDVLPFDQPQLFDEARRCQIAKRAAHRGSAAPSGRLRSMVAMLEYS